MPHPVALLKPLNRLAAMLAITFCCGLVAPAAQAAEIVINVSGVTSATGQIGCSLFASAAGFPMDISGARQVWLAARPEGVTCRFAELADGRYAVSIGHDLNGNKKVDTNLLGIPTEAWGVSGNVRPTLRAPTWDEAAFSVAQGKDVTLTVKVAK